MVDDRAQADESQRERAELFRFIVESAEDYAIFTTDIERRVTSWNVGAERLMGWSEAEFTGQSADVIFTPEDREAGQADKEANKALAQGRADNLRWHMKKDGSRFWGDGVMRPLKDDAGNTRGFVKIFRDRTAELQAEEARKEADRRKDEFLAMLSHELRNPLSAIASASQLSLRVDADAETIAWSKEVIARQVQNLSHMIADLLDISRINRGKIHLKKEPTHVGPVVTRAVEASAPLIQEKNHELNVSISTGLSRVNADPTRLEQIITNLLVNAAKYSDPGGTIIVTAQPEDGGVVIKVKDNGIGLSPEMLTEVFEMFSQVDKSLDRTRGGLGIGLSVVKKLVEMHGGTVWASSEGLGKGSEFAVRLPAITESKPSKGERNRSTLNSGSPSRRILVVDDNVDSAIGLARLLRLVGHEVEIAHEGTAAIEIADVFRPEMVLLDIGLPGMSGYDLASELRTHESSRESVFIAVSGYGQEQDRERSRIAGFDHHLAKPVDFDALIELISSGRH